MTLFSLLVASQVHQYPCLNFYVQTASWIAHSLSTWYNGLASKILLRAAMMKHTVVYCYCYDDRCWCYCQSVNTVSESKTINVMHRAKTFWTPHFFLFSLCLIIFVSQLRQDKVLKSVGFENSSFLKVLGELARTPTNKRILITK